MQHEQWCRVTKNDPCPICGRGDWCLVAKDKSAVICPRTEAGSVKEIEGSGFLHKLDDRREGRQYHPQRRFAVGRDDKPARDFKALHEQYVRQITTQQLDELSRLLGVSRQSLQRLGTGWCGKSFTFPMYNHFGKTIGIRRRFPSGSKVSLKGSKAGLFIPAELAGSEPLLITEGPSDCAAALDLGFDAFGRPNCDSKVNMTARFTKGRDVIIIADNDTPKRDGRNPGQAGALKLARKLVFVCSSVRIILPPTEYKDLRGWYRAGLKHDELLVTINNTKPLTAELR